MKNIKMTVTEKKEAVLEIEGQKVPVQIETRHEIVPLTNWGFTTGDFHLYGVGVEDDRGGIGMIDGPTNKLNLLLDNQPTSLASQKEIEGKKVFIFELKKEGNIPIYRWNWASSKWVRLKE